MISDFKPMKYSIKPLKFKWLLIMSLLFGVFACNSDKDKLQSKIDRLEKQLADTYKPGFGEIMGSVQIHHSKLWFAGINENWKLAEFEVHELTEAIEDIEKYQKDREESKYVKMIQPPLDSVAMAIKQKNLSLFENNYTKLTTTCNECHQVTKYEYIVIKNPDMQIFHDQDFRVEE